VYRFLKYKIESGNFMKLIDKICVLQDELNKMLSENKYSNKELLKFSEKLDKLIARYYMEDESK
jgi:hypothetical protein